MEMSEFGYQQSDTSNSKVKTSKDTEELVGESLGESLGSTRNIR